MFVIVVYEFECVKLLDFKVVCCDKVGYIIGVDVMGVKDVESFVKNLF